MRDDGMSLAWMLQRRIVAVGFLQIRGYTWLALGPVLLEELRETRIRSRNVLIGPEPTKPASVSHSFTLPESRSSRSSRICLISFRCSAAWRANPGNPLSRIRLSSD